MSTRSSARRREKQKSATDQPPTLWRDWRPVALLLVAAFGIKATVLVQLGGHPLLQPHGELDTALYIDLAQQIAAGGPLAVTEPFFVSPLYVYVLALVFGLGASIRAVQVVQILLGTATVGLVFLTARRGFGQRTAWIAAALAATTGLFTFYEILILQAAIDPFLVATTLYFISRVQLDDRPWLVAGAGAGMGLLTLNRPNALVYGIVVTVWLAIRAWWGPESVEGRGAGRASRAR